LNGPEDWILAFLRTLLFSRSAYSTRL